MIKRVIYFLSISLAILSTFDAAFAATISYLEVTQRSYDTTSAGVTPYEHGGAGDPTLIYSSNSQTPAPYNEHIAKYSITRKYQSADSSVRYSDFPLINPHGIISVGTPDLGYSNTLGYGYVSAAERILREHVTVHSNTPSNIPSYNSESLMKGDITNRFTVQAGTSGLNAGDTARLRLDFRLDGTLSATGTSGYQVSHTYSQMMAGLNIKDPLVKIYDGEGWFTPNSVSFGADASIIGDGIYFPYWGYSYANEISTGWGAGTNTGDGSSFSEDYEERVINEGVEVNVSKYFDTGLLGLEFDAIVGHTLDFSAWMNVSCLGAGPSSASSDFSTTFGSFIIDPNGTGVQIGWEGSNEQVPAVPVPGAIWLLGSGLAGLVVARRNRRAITHRQ